jgi:hypothetical protein
LDVLLVNRSIGMEFVEAIKGKGREGKGREGN